MADLKFKPVRHDHKQFLEQASRRRGFTDAYEALDVEYALAHEMLAARARWPYPRGRCWPHGHYQERNFSPGVCREACSLCGITEEIRRRCWLHAQDRTRPRQRQGAKNCPTRQSA